MSSPISCKCASKCNSVAIVMLFCLLPRAYFFRSSKTQAPVQNSYVSAYIFLNENAMNIRKA